MEVSEKKKTKGMKHCLIKTVCWCGPFEDSSKLDPRGLNQDCVVFVGARVQHLAMPRIALLTCQAANVGDADYVRQKMSDSNGMALEAHSLLLVIPGPFLTLCTRESVSWIQRLRLMSCSNVRFWHFVNECHRKGDGSPQQMIPAYPLAVDVGSDGAVAAAVTLGLNLREQSPAASPALLGLVAVGRERLVQGRLEGGELALNVAPFVPGTPAYCCDFDA